MLRVLFALPSPLPYETLRLYLNLGYWPHIRRPRSFNEKVVHRMLYAPHPLSAIVADKWKVREYVAGRGLAGILNEVYWVGTDPDRIPFDRLPGRYVVKATRGSGWNAFVTDKSPLSETELIARCRQWLGRKLRVTARTNEKHYDLVPPMIVIENYIEDEKHGFPVDYRFFCFHGKVGFVKAFFDKHGNQRTLTFSADWEPMAIMHGPRYLEPVARPTHLQSMNAIAESLSAGFDFVRVDLYSPNDSRVVFGELTLTPANGLVELVQEWDFRIGQLW